MQAAFEIGGFVESYLFAIFKIIYLLTHRSFLNRALLLPYHAAVREDAYY